MSHSYYPAGHQLFTWSWAPPVSHRHLGCCRSGEHGCCTSSPPGRRRCTCRCNRASCCWWTAGPLSSAASSAQLLSGPNGCSADTKTNSFYILGIKLTLRISTISQKCLNSAHSLVDIYACTDGKRKHNPGHEYVHSQTILFLISF